MIQALLWGIIIPFEHTHTNPRFATLMFAWSLTEVRAGFVPCCTTVPQR